MFFEVAHFFREFGQEAAALEVDPALMGDDLSLHLSRG
jgi:hypothetical protein